MLAHPVLPLARQTAAYRRRLPDHSGGRTTDYCFALAGLVRSQVRPYLPGLDYCALEPGLLASRDTGVEQLYPVHGRRRHDACACRRRSIRGGTTPARSPAAARRSSAGWPSRSPRGPAADGAARVTPRSPSPSTTTQAIERVVQQRRRGEHAQSTTVNLRNGWSVESFAAAPAADLHRRTRAHPAARGNARHPPAQRADLRDRDRPRSRPRRLCARRTRELSHQALHDIAHRAAEQGARVRPRRTAARAGRARPGTHPGRAVRRRRLLQERQRQFRARGRRPAPARHRRSAAQRDPRPRHRRAPERRRVRRPARVRHQPRPRRS